MRRAPLLVFLWLVPAVALAQTEELENPGVVSAVQERTYRLHHELNLGFGTLPLDAFSKGVYPTLSYVYHFSDHFAWQVGRGGYVYNINSGLREQLERDFAVLPTAFDEVQYFVGSDVMWSPIYGKTSVLNKHVLHFEMYLLGGASVLKLSNSGFRPALDAGLGARLFQSKWMSYRLETTWSATVAQKPQLVANIQLLAALNFGASE